MTIQTIPNNSVIIQHAFTYGPEFTDMLRLTYQRHAAYALAHNFDYWHIIGGVHDYPIERGGWDKVKLIHDALEQGYEHIVWIDTDAAIINFECDLRDALPAGACIGAALHDPAKSGYLQQMQVPKHYNVGVMYIKAGAKPFIAEWLNRYYGRLERFLEQGEFNRMVEDPAWTGYFAPVEDKWNATVNVNMVKPANVIGWHGIAPYAKRLAMMQEALRNDYLEFHV